MRDIPPAVMDDPVLSAFIAACERPTPADLIAWTGRHPDQADEILEIAEILLVATTSEPFAELASRCLQTAERHLADALAKAHAESAPRPTFRGASRKPSRSRNPDRS